MASEPCDGNANEGEKKPRRDNSASPYFAEFKAARSDFCKRYSDIRPDHGFFRGSIGDVKLTRELKDSEKCDSAFSESTMIKIIHFMKYPDPTVLHGYDHYKTITQQNSGYEKTILEKYKGEYSYFRFCPPDLNQAPEYGKGRVKISERGGIPYFELWSSNFEGGLQSTSPENSGEVYGGHDKLYFLGHRHQVFRLAICKEIGSNIKHGIMKGIVLSVTAGSYEPFAARFIMIHEDNVADIERYSNAVVDSNTQRAHGEFEFERLWGDLNNMMLLTPRKRGDAPARLQNLIPT